MEIDYTHTGIIPEHDDYVFEDVVSPTIPPVNNTTVNDTLFSSIKPVELDYDKLVGKKTLEDGGYIGDFFHIARLHIEDAKQRSELTESNAGEVFSTLFSQSMQQAIAYEQADKEMQLRSISNTIDTQIKLYNREQEAVNLNELKYRMEHMLPIEYLKSKEDLYNKHAVHKLSEEDYLIKKFIHERLQPVEESTNIEKNKIAEEDAKSKKYYTDNMQEIEKDILLADKCIKDTTCEIKKLDKKSSELLLGEQDDGSFDYNKSMERYQLLNTTYKNEQESNKVLTTSLNNELLFIKKTTDTLTNDLKGLEKTNLGYKNMQESNKVLTTTLNNQLLSIKKISDNLSNDLKGLEKTNLGYKNEQESNKVLTTSLDNELLNIRKVTDTLTNDLKDLEKTNLGYKNMQEDNKVLTTSLNNELLTLRKTTDGLTNDLKGLEKINLGYKNEQESNKVLTTSLNNELLFIKKTTDNLNNDLKVLEKTNLGYKNEQESNKVLTTLLDNELKSIEKIGRNLDNDLKGLSKKSASLLLGQKADGNFDYYNSLANYQVMIEKEQSTLARMKNVTEHLNQLMTEAQLLDANLNNGLQDDGSYDHSKSMSTIKKNQSIAITAQEQIKAGLQDDGSYDASKSLPAIQIATMSEQRDMYARQRKAFDDRKYQELLKMQMNYRGMIFADNPEPVVPDLVKEPNINDIYKSLTTKDVVIVE
jgi:hypothetical protein